LDQTAIETCPEQINDKPRIAAVNI